MQTELYISINGDSIQPDQLKFSKATEFCSFLIKGAVPFIKFIECKQLGQCEIIVFEIEPEVPQHPVHDISSNERLAVAFSENEPPLVMALRNSFPIVPHLHFTFKDQPRFLCLTEESYVEQQRYWTPALLVRQIHRWLSLTSRGELHQSDQPLEPFFFGNADRLILPAVFFDNEPVDLKQMVIYIAGRTLGKTTLIATTPDKKPLDVKEADVRFIGCVITIQPQLHGIIRQRPRTLKELQNQLAESGQDIVVALRHQLREWFENKTVTMDSALLLLLRIPKIRELAGPVEAIETWAFPTTKTITQVGEELGIWGVYEQNIGLNILPDTSKNGEDVPIDIYVPTSTLTKKQAALFNGLTMDERQYLAIGAGALGSQVLNNVIRAGQGQWIVLDEDQLLPHNVARHFLPGHCIGTAKAESMALLLNATTEQKSIKPIVANVLKGEWQASLQNEQPLDCIIDMSASVSVARYLASDTIMTARRISLFINPTGSDLVLLAEPEDRSIKLDQLEMEYYCSLVHTPALQGHLLQNGKPIKYSYACRDVSLQIPQDQVALHAAIGARALRTTLATSHTQIKVWRSKDDLTVTATEIIPSLYEVLMAGKWEVCISRRLITAISKCRKNRLPNETGGVLIGSFDMQRTRIYLVDQIPSPPDSKEWPTAYIRGVEGLAERLSEISNYTAQQLIYIGEWHSHPFLSSTNPSNDDIKLFEWLGEQRLCDGLPAVISIVGDNNISLFVDDINSGRAEIAIIN